MDKRRSANGPPCTAGWLATYRPQRHNGPTWAAIRPFVVSCAEQLGLEKGPRSLRVVRVLALVAAWAFAQGLPLGAEVVLDPANVECFIASTDGAASSRATYRSTLRRLGPLLTRQAPWEARPPAVSRRQVARPYSASELQRLRVATLAQPTPGRRRAARALLALGAGAGLDGRWVARIGCHSIFRRGGTILVRVSEPCCREVPVLADWEDEVLELAATAGAEFLVGGRSNNPNRVAALVSSLVVPSGQPRLCTRPAPLHLASGPLGHGHAPARAGTRCRP